MNNYKRIAVIGFVLFSVISICLVLGVTPPPCYFQCPPDKYADCDSYECVDCLMDNHCAQGEVCVNHVCFDPDTLCVDLDSQYGTNQSLVIASCIDRSGPHLDSCLGDGNLQEWECIDGSCSPYTVYCSFNHLACQEGRCMPSKCQCNYEDPVIVFYNDTRCVISTTTTSTIPPTTTLPSTTTTMPPSTTIPSTTTTTIPGGVIPCQNDTDCASLNCPQGDNWIGAIGYDTPICCNGFCMCGGVESSNYSYTCNDYDSNGGEFDNDCDTKANCYDSACRLAPNCWGIHPCADGECTYPFDCEECEDYGDCTAEQCELGPQTEICDGKDNDLDGEIDEGCDDDNDDYCDATMNYAEPECDCRCNNITDVVCGFKDGQYLLYKNDCERGCDDALLVDDTFCTATPTTTTLPGGIWCDDPDGNNYLVKGMCRDSTHPTIIHMDECVYSIGGWVLRVLGGTPVTTRLKEFNCTVGGCTPHVIDCKNVFGSEFICDDGRCRSTLPPIQCRNNADCDAANQFCEKTPGDCNGMGYCSVRPQDCTLSRQYDPVCGCNNITYGNDCERQMAGVSKKADEECPEYTCVEYYDSGRDPYTLGQTCLIPLDQSNTNPICYMDHCDADTGLTLIEYYCNTALDNIIEEPIYCQHGCSNGVCIQYTDQCWSNSECEEGFCEFEDEICNPPGACTEIPDACTTEYNPVCGCDGVVYGNDCVRQVFNQSKAPYEKCDETSCNIDAECTQCVPPDGGADTNCVYCWNVNNPEEHMCVNGDNYIITNIFACVDKLSECELIEKECSAATDCQHLYCTLVYGGDTPKCNPLSHKCYCGGVCGDGYCDIYEEESDTCKTDCEG